MATQKLCGKIKPFDTGFEPTMFHLANGRNKLKIQQHCFSVKKKFFNAK